MGTYPTPMYETGHRAHHAQSLRPQRLGWYSYALDSKEGFEEPSVVKELPGDCSLDPYWFQIQSYQVSQPPSTVLVEKVVIREDVEIKPYQRKRRYHSTTLKTKAKLWDEELGHAMGNSDDLKGKREIGGRSNYNHGTWNKSKREDQTPEDRKGATKAEWRHLGAVTCHTGARTTDQKLRTDGLGRVPSIASSLAVIRRLELDTDGFFRFLFSDRWKEGCLLRVLKGQLLDKLLHVLHQMEKYHDVVCHSTMAYICHHRSLEPCSKTPTTTDTAKVVEEQIQVDLDSFHPQRRPQTVTEWLNARDSSDSPEVLSQSIHDVWDEIQDTKSSLEAETVHGTPGIRCNMRGRQKPPPHSNCLSSYHMQREPFLLRCYRQQSTFPQLTLPPLPQLSMLGSSSEAKQKKKRDEQKDDAFLGPKLEDDSEPVADDICLIPISKLLSENLCTVKACLGNRNTSPTTSNKLSTTTNKPPDRKKKKKKTAKENMSDEEDSDPDEEQEFHSCVDALRQKGLQKDLDLMSSELVAQKPIPKKIKLSVQGRLKRESAIHYTTRCEQGKMPKEAVKKEAACQHTVIEQATTVEVTKRSAEESSLKQEQPTDLPYSFLTKWPECPSFAQFYDYLREQEKQEQTLARQSKQKKLPGSKISKDVASVSESKKEPSPKKKKKMKSTDPKLSENSENTDQLTDGSERKTRNARDEQKSTKKKKSSKKEQTTQEKQNSKSQDQSASEKQSKAWTEEDSPYVNIRDSEVPDDITPSSLFQLMQVDRYFTPEKLKNSYSFEKMFAHRSHEVPSYAKLLSVFSKPFKKKKPSPVSRRAGPKRTQASRQTTKEGTAPQYTESRQTTKEGTVLQSPAEPSPPPMVIGKMRDFTFLQYKDYIPKPASSTAPVPSSEVSLTHIAQLLTRAMQKFVIRKERATTYNPYQCCSKVSITFSKRTPDQFWLGVPPLTDNKYIRHDPDCPCTTK